MCERERWAIGLDSDEERVQVIAEDGSHVCYVERDPVMGNAVLIAAAPEMYEALCDAHDAMLMDRNGGWTSRRSFLAVARVLDRVKGVSG